MIFSYAVSYGMAGRMERHTSADAVHLTDRIFSDSFGYDRMVWHSGI